MTLFLGGVEDSSYKLEGSKLSWAVDGIELVLVEGSPQPSCCKYYADFVQHLIHKCAEGLSSRLLAE